MALASMIHGMYANAQYRYLPNFTVPYRWVSRTLTGGALAFSPDGGMLAEGTSNSPFLSVVYSATLSGVSSPPTVPVGVNDLAWSPDGTKLAVGLNRTTSPNIIVYNVSNWSVAANYFVTGTPRSLAFSGDGQWLLYGSTTSPYWGRIATATGAVTTGSVVLSDFGWSCAAHPTAAIGAIGAGGSTGRLRIIDLATGTSTAVTGLPAGTYTIDDLAWSPDGTKLLAATGTAAAVLIIDPVTAAVTATRSYSTRVRACAWFPDSDRFVFGVENGSYGTVINNVSGSISQVLSIVPGTAACYALAVSPEIDYPAARVRVWLPDGTERLGAAAVSVQSAFSSSVGNNTVANQLSQGGADAAWNDTSGIVFGFTSGAHVLSLRQSIGGVLYQGATVAHLKTGAPWEFDLQLVPNAVPTRQLLAGGPVTTTGGVAADEVLIHHRGSKLVAGRATPDIAGDWSIEVAPGVYDLTYWADGCGPVIHGPYTVAAP